MKRYISKSQCKLCILSLKYVPIICVLLMLLHIIFSLLGFNLCISEMSILTLCSIMVLVWTHCFKFCLLHKLYTIYVLIGLWLMSIHRFIGLGYLLGFFRISMLYLGFILLIVTSIKLRITYVEGIKRLIDENSGNSNIDESQTIEIASAIGELVSRYNKPKIPNKLTRLEACRHLRVSETKFNMLRRKGLISEGTKKAGDVRKWSIEELDKYIKNNS